MKNRKERAKNISSERINKKVQERVTSESTSQLSSKDEEEETKDFFRQKEQYKGHCQICGDTFKMKSGYNYCERFTWTRYKRAEAKTDIVSPDNSLCLCARCHAIINNGGDFDATFLNVFKNDMTIDAFIEMASDIECDFVPQVFEEHKEFGDMFALPIRILNEPKHIFYTQEHLLKFYLWLMPNNN